jgi:hypothetical protein
MNCNVDSKVSHLSVVRKNIKSISCFFGKLIEAAFLELGYGQLALTMVTFKLSWPPELLHHGLTLLRSTTRAGDRTRGSEQGSICDVETFAGKVQIASIHKSCNHGVP